MKGGKGCRSLSMEFTPCCASPQSNVRKASDVRRVPDRNDVARPRDLSSQRPRPAQPETGGICPAMSGICMTSCSASDLEGAPDGHAQLHPAPDGTGFLLDTVGDSRRSSSACNWVRTSHRMTETASLVFVKVRTRLDRPNILLDGIGEGSPGFLNVMYDPELKDCVRKWAGEAVIPVMLLTPPSEDANLSLEATSGQVFHDMNVHSTPVAMGLAVDLDRSDMYIQTGQQGHDAADYQRERRVRSPRYLETPCIPVPGRLGPWCLKAVRAAAEGPGSACMSTGQAISLPKTHG